MCHKLLLSNVDNKSMHTRKVGDIGENVACTFLKKNGFTVIDRNYFKKWGELDIVARKDGFLHFFEVKSVVRQYETKSFIERDYVRSPEENVHSLKVRSLRKIIQTYLVEKGGGLDVVFEFHVLSVFLNKKTRTARIKWIKNVIL